MKLEAKLKKAKRRIKKLEAVLIWCSGLDFFGPGGKEEKGWKKFCEPLLKDLLNKKGESE